MIYNKLQKFVNVIWYGNSNKNINFVLCCLQPLSWIFVCICRLRKCYYKIFRKTNTNIPVIIIGGINVGGTGKTSLVIYVVNELLKLNLRVGIIMRGYGGINKTVVVVKPDADALIVGDEALLIAKNCNCPVVISKQRVLARDHLLQNYNVEVIISDDGLQHYALDRDIEIAVLDGRREFGNGYMLPIGPLREPISRLKEVNFVVSKNKLLPIDIKQYLMQYVISICVNASNGKQVSLNTFSRKVVHAIAGISDPHSFFLMLEKLSITVIRHAFPDHYQYVAEDLHFNDNYPIITTEKDLVKYQKVAHENIWYVKLDIIVDMNFIKNLISLLDNKRNR